ncbi:MAG: hypothetical protein AAFO07_23910 [Bacteroidota bacterium]
MNNEGVTLLQHCWSRALLGNDHMNNSVKVHIQYAFCDFRKFSNDHNNLLPLPNWKVPIEKKHFVPYFGTMEKRGKELPAVFNDEKFFIKGKGGLKFVDLEKTQLANIRCIYRKLYSDGLCGARYEVGLNFNGFDFKNSKIVPENQYDHKQVVDEIINKVFVTEKHLSKYKRKSTSILESDKRVALLYQKATSAVTDDSKLHNIKYGNLCLIFEIDNNNATTKNVLFDNVIEIEEGFKVFVKKYKTRGKELAIFTIVGDILDNEQLTREIRIIILRLYYEYQNLRLLIQFAQNPNNSIYHDTFDKYLMKKLRYFNKAVESQTNKQALSIFLLKIFEVVSPGEIETLSENIQNIRFQIKKNLIQFISDNQLNQESRFKHEIHNKIRAYLVEDNLEGALNLLEKVNEIESVVLLKSRLKKLELDFAKGLLTYSQNQIERNRLVHAILLMMQNGNN